MIPSTQNYIESLKSRNEVKTMSNYSIRVEIFKDGDVYVAWSPELNVSSFGETIEEAKSAIREAIEAFVEECEAMGTLKDVLEEAGFTKDMDVWMSRIPIAEERLALAV